MPLILKKLLHDKFYVYFSSAPVDQAGYMMILYYSYQGVPKQGWIIPHNNLEILVGKVKSRVTMAKTR